MTTVPWGISSSGASRGNSIHVPAAPVEWFRISAERMMTVAAV